MNIRLTDLILELNIRAKEPYAAGTEHEIYKDSKDPNKVYRVVMQGHPDISKQAYNWVEIFKKYPQYFPAVYKSTERGASVEKLNTNKAMQEFDDINNTLRGEMEETKKLGWFTDLLKDIAEGLDRKSVINKVGMYLQENEPSLASAFKRYINLMIKLQPINSPEHTLDAHAGNFGYDKQGRLKMLDL